MTYSKLPHKRMEIEIIKKLIIQLSVILKNGLNQKNKHIWTIIGTIAQIITGFLIFGTFIVSICNNRQQERFNRTAFRPWIYIEPLNNIEISDSIIYLDFNLKNLGNYGGYNIMCWDTITFSDTFPNSKRQMDSLIRRIGSIKPGGFIHVNERQVPTINYLTITKINKDSLFTLARNQSIYLHVYIEYQDYSRNSYYQKNTYITRGIYSGNSPIGYSCNWEEILSLEEHLP